jgi:uncharacterized protein YjiS (DUF1127 family)
MAKSAFSMGLRPGRLLCRVADEILLYAAASAHSQIRQVHDLRELDDRLLGDIGLERDQARRCRWWKGDEGGES